MAANTETPAGTAIRSGAVYLLEDFKRLTGLGNAAMRTARRRGLRVIYSAGRAFVRGDDFIEYLAASTSSEVADGT